VDGDKYLTTSTTSLTIGNGSKTLTVGLDLAYSITQQATIAYDVNNHMHGEVTAYNPATGSLTVDVTHHSGSGTYTAWTVNLTGATGTAATITVGTVTTGAPGSSASVTNSGSTTAAVFDFSIPRGDVGATGATGPQGPTGATGATGPAGADGAAATIAVGTVTTGAAGSSATVTNSGTSSAAVFDFAIPQGATGATGVVTATAPIAYNSGTQTVSLDALGITTGYLANNAVTYGKLSATGASAGQVLSYDGSALAWITAGGSPAGSTGQFQFNSAGAFAGSAALTWNAADSRLVITSQSTSKQTLTINNAMGQTSDLQWWAVGVGVPMWVTGQGELRLVSNANANIPVRIRGTASQSGNLTEWRNSGDTATLASVSPSGAAVFSGSISVNGAGSITFGSGGGQILGGQVSGTNAYLQAKTSSSTGTAEISLIKSTSAAAANWKYWGSSGGSEYVQMDNSTTNGMRFTGGPWSFGTAANPTATVHITGSTTTRASLRVASGTAPTTPNDGDIWYTGTYLQHRQSGETRNIATMTTGTGAPSGTPPVGTYYLDDTTGSERLYVYTTAGWKYTQVQ